MAKFNSDLTVNNMIIENKSADEKGQLSVRVDENTDVKIRTIILDSITTGNGQYLLDNISDEDQILLTAKAFKDYIRYLIDNNLES